LLNDIASLRQSFETRTTELEKSDALFEEHRQSWIRLNEKLQELKDEMVRDTREYEERQRKLSQRTANIFGLNGLDSTIELE